MAFRRIELTLN